MPVYPAAHICASDFTTRRPATASDVRVGRTVTAAYPAGAEYTVNLKFRLRVGLNLNLNLNFKFKLCSSWDSDLDR